MTLVCGMMSLVNLSGATEQTTPVPSEACQPAQVISLDGGGWFLSADPGNVGREQKWWEKPRPDAKATKIPSIQDRGVAWYWRDVEVPANPCPDGRYLLRFWDVDYLADVWVNGVTVGSHEGARSPFVLDVTDAVKPGTSNRIAVRVLYPGDAPIDGFTYGQTPHGVARFFPAAGGIMDSVEFLVAPAVRVDHLFVLADPKTGRMPHQRAPEITWTRKDVDGKMVDTIETKDVSAVGGR